MNKPYYRIKGRWKDGRKKVIIEEIVGLEIKSKTLPKSEVLLKILTGQSSLSHSTKEKNTKNESS